MSVIDITMRTISCNAPGCEKTVTFNRQEEKQTFENPDNAWMRTSRIVQTADGRNYVYCSDLCTIKGVETGILNMPTPKTVVPAANAQAVALAAQAAEAAKKTEAALRNGGNIQITDN